MTTAALIVGFVCWAIAILVAGVVGGAGTTRAGLVAQKFIKTSGVALVVLIVLIVAEGWWQEGPLRFASSPKAVLIIAIEDHGVKYVTPEAARIIKLFDKLFFLLIMPFLALFWVRRSKARAQSNSGRHDA